MTKPLYVVVCESRFFHALPAHINVVNLSGPASARSRALMPDAELLRRFKNLTPSCPINEPTACASAYVDLLVSRYKANEVTRITMLDMIEKPILVVVIGRDPSAINWEFVAIKGFLMRMAAHRGRNAEFLGRVRPARQAA